VDRWSEATNIPRGYVMAATQCWELGRRWYGDRLTPDWQPKTPETMRQIFADVGLHGDFWRV